MKDKINPNLKRLAELTCNPSLELPDLKKIAEKTPIQANKLEKDAQGKPKIKLMPLEKTAVNTKTQEAYNTLMQVYECGGWRSLTKELPISINYWERYEKETCIDACSQFRYGNKRCNQEMMWEVIPTKQFYNKQNITDNMIKEINEYFENKK